MTEKKEIKRNLHDVLEDLDGKSLDDAANFLLNIKLTKEYNIYHRFELQADWDYSCQELNLIGFRWETDKELVSRLKKAKKAKEKRKVNTDKKDAKEYKEYERLKKKFEEKLPGLAGE